MQERRQEANQIFCRNRALRIGKWCGMAFERKVGVMIMRICLQLEPNCVLPSCRKDILCKHLPSDHAILVSGLVVGFLQSGFTKEENMVLLTLLSFYRPNRYILQTLKKGA